MAKSWEVVDVKSGTVEINSTRVEFWARVWGKTPEGAAKSIAKKSPLMTARVAA